MRFSALATDYDGTLAHHGRVEPETLEHLQRLRDGGRRLILITGRILSDLQEVFPEYALFHRIVAENGALVFDPSSREETLLCPPPPARLIQRLTECGVEPLSEGRVIVATWEPHETTVLRVIHELGLELQVIFNKGAVMVLPSGINKAAGLRAALGDLGLSCHNAVGVGDAENDHALLGACEAAVAVANALPSLKACADWITRGERGEGVVEVARMMLEDDLLQLEPHLERWHTAFGETDDGTPVTMPARGVRALLCGTSGSGKSTLATAFLERLAERSYQFIVVDPEGDFEILHDSVQIGDSEHPPPADEIERLLSATPYGAVANLLAVPIAERTQFLSHLQAHLEEYRRRFARPHWTVIDEAHHMLGSESSVELPKICGNVLFITVHPERLARPILESVNVLIVVGDAPDDAVRSFAEATGRAMPEVAEETLEERRGIAWFERSPHEIVRFRASRPRAERRRHRRKYAAGELGPDKSFYFTGPKRTLRLRAHNLALFLQIADGLDAETWNHHLVRHDYSRWLRDSVKDRDLAAEVLAVERAYPIAAGESRRLVRAAIENRYTLPA